MKWTKDICKNKANKYEYKKDFLKNEKNCYQACYRKGWLDEICIHMKVSGDKYNRCIYLYKFSNNYFYIGLTCDIERRHKEHIKNTSKIGKFIKDNNLTYELKIIEDYQDYKIVCELEKFYINDYLKRGYNLINDRKGGSLGVSNILYTKEKCLEVLNKFNNITIINDKFPTVIQKCLKNKWHLDKIESMRINKKNGYWTEEKCEKVVKKYSTLKDLNENNPTVYRKIKKEKWDYLLLQLKSKKPKGFWDYSTCKEESKKYKNRYNFQINSRGAYKKAYENNWLNEFYPKL